MLSHVIANTFNPTYKVFHACGQRCDGCRTCLVKLCELIAQFGAFGCKVLVAVIRLFGAIGNHRAYPLQDGAPNEECYLL